MEPSPAPELRSLTIGEIFDRATTMYVRNFLVFTLIVLTLLAPAAVVRFLLLGNRAAGDLSALLDQIRHPGHVTPAAGMNASLIAAAFGLGLLTLILAPYVNNAVAVGVAMLYRGEAPDYALAFRRVFARGGQLFATILLCGLLLLGIYVAMVFFMVFAVVLVRLTFGAAEAFGIVVLIAAVFAFACAFILAALACVFALYATTLEGETAGPAIAQAFARLFNRSEIGKAALLMLAYIALELIALAVTGGIAFFIESIVHSTALELTFSTIAGAMLNAYITILLAVYYFDVRTRVEGLDLEVDIARLSPS